MAILDDLATAIQALADSIRAVDADTALSVAEGASEQAASLGSAELTASLAGAKESVENVKAQLAQLAAEASTTANEIRGMT